MSRLRGKPENDASKGNVAMNAVLVHACYTLLKQDACE